jgi:hypothetical protein
VRAALRRRIAWRDRFVTVVLVAVLLAVALYAAYAWLRM